MQSTVKGVPLSSKEMCNITENDAWNRLGFSRSISRYPVLNTVTRLVSRLVHRRLLNAIKTKFSKDVMYVCKQKMSAYHFLFCELMKSLAAVQDYFLSVESR